MKNQQVLFCILLFSLLLIYACKDEEKKPCTPQTWFEDADGDGFGNANHPISACEQPTGYVSNSMDCNDLTPSVNPNAVEVVDDNIDNDCNGSDSCTVHIWYLDADGDGFGDINIKYAVCGMPFGYVQDSTDCNDQNVLIYSSAIEIPDDGLDNNCDGCNLRTWYKDNDGDGYGVDDDTVLGCEQPDGYTSAGKDCVDDNIAINPGAEEVMDDGIDNNCDGSTDGGTVWDGPTLVFAKAANTDWTLPQNQDKLTDKVIFTRQDKTPIYNYQWWHDNLGEDATEDYLKADFWNYKDSPFAPIGGTRGVRWALLDDTGAQNPWDPDFDLYGVFGDPAHFYSFHNLASMIRVLEEGDNVVGVLDDFDVELEGGGNYDFTTMSLLIDKNLGLWLVEEDIFLSLTFTEWGEKNGGSIAYKRSTQP